VIAPFFRSIDFGPFCFSPTRTLPRTGKNGGKEEKCRREKVARIDISVFYCNKKEIRATDFLVAG
jgi:hypothetical protein